MALEMVMVVVRALQSAIAVVAGIVTASQLGNTDKAKLVAVPIAFVASILIEYALVKAPKSSRRIRKWLDPRAVFEGVWIQDITAVLSEDPGPRNNTFAVLVVTYGSGAYAVDGTAYDLVGNQHSRWHSNEQVQFSGDGRSLTYVWEGTVRGQDATGNDLDRTGFAQMRLSSDDGGTGRVDHVAMKVTLTFDLKRVTEELAGRDPDLLKAPAERHTFAKMYAKTLPSAAA